MKTFNIVIVGVGGQGVILASKIISNAALEAGLDVKQSEVHGMSQRGGSVISHVRVGKKVYSPLVTEGEADVVLAFEKLEALRYSHWAKPDGKIIYADTKINPSTVVAGLAEYPDDVDEQLKNLKCEVIKLDAAKLAQEAGNVKAVNTVLVGALSKYLPEISIDTWKKVVETSVPKKVVEVNLKAFDLGYNAMQ